LADQENDVPRALIINGFGMRSLPISLAWITAAIVAATGAIATETTSLKPTLSRLGVDRWSTTGYRGQGIKVVVLDTGFRGYRNFFGKTLPHTTFSRSFRFDGDMEAKDSQHGIYCAEVIHAIAPEAEIFLASWQPDSPESLIAAVNWARKIGANIISCSVIMPCWSDGEGGGVIHQELCKVIGDGSKPGDLLAVACAGNVAQRHWHGPFCGTPGSLHQWPNGSTENHIVAYGEELVSVELSRPDAAGYALQVLTESGKEVARAVASTSDAGRSMAIRFVAQRDARYAVRVQHASGFPGQFHLTVLGGTLEHRTVRGSIPFPGDGPEWVTVGAWENDRRAPYSSCGANAKVRKPDLVAPVPFPGLSRAKPFEGTSAASPQAAALAAIYWSAYPHATAAQVRTALCSAAEDLLAPGHDNETGFGLLRLP
jgi:subtilisin family serine protease